MSLRFSLNFGILTGRNPVLRSATGSKLRKLIGVVKDSLDNAVAALNDAYDARFISTASGEDLDLHGEALDLVRQPAESDSDYRTRLLTEFQSIPQGLTVQEILDAVETVTGETNLVDEYYKSTWDWPDFVSPSYSTFGNETVGASSGSKSGDTKVGCRFQITSDGNLQLIKAYLGLTGGGTRLAYCAIYSDNVGAPDAKIAAAASTKIVDSSGWYSFDFSDLQLSKDSYYWLVINVTGGAWTFNYDAGSTNQAAYNSDTPPPDDPFGAPTYENRSYSIYASYIIADSTYAWEKWLNDRESRFKAAVITYLALSSVQLDQIEQNVIEKKPAHMIVRIVQDRPQGYELLREIL